MVLADRVCSCRSSGICQPPWAGEHHHVRAPASPPHQRLGEVLSPGRCRPPKAVPPGRGLERFLTHPFVEQLPGIRAFESVRSSANLPVRWNGSPNGQRRPLLPGTRLTDLLVVKSTRELGDRTLSLLERCRSAAPEGSLDLEQLYHFQRLRQPHRRSLGQPGRTPGTGGLDTLLRPPFSGIRTRYRRARPVSRSWDYWRPACSTLTG